MMTTLADLFRSKKFLVAIIAIAAGVAARYGFALDQAAVMEIVTPLWAFIVGQGIADHGKEAAKIDAAASSPTVTTP